MPHLTAHDTQQRRACYFTGRVQGVGFRYTVHNLSLQYNIHGFVRNLPDGRVEVVCEGEPQEINHFIDSIAQKMQGFIKKVDSDTAPATGEFDHFYIRH